MNIDKEIFSAAQAGDPGALEQLLRHLQPDIYRYARHQCYAATSIEDVVQEALIILYRKVGTIRSPAALGGWLIKVVTRLCMLPVLMLLRSVEELNTVQDSARFSLMPVDELRLDLVRGLESLPLHYREIILLRDLKEMTIKEIADLLRLSREATKSRLHRARGMIREFLIPGNVESVNSKEIKDGDGK